VVDRFQARDVLIPYGIFLVIILVAFVAPPLGMFVGMFPPVPLILVYLQRGKITGLITITAVGLALLILVGPQLAIAFIGAYGIMAAAMAETTRLSFSFEKTILFSALAPAILTGLVIFTGIVGKEESLSKYLENALKQEAEEYIKVIEKSGETLEKIKDIREYIDQTAPLLASIFPAFILVSSLVGAVINFLAARYLWLRFYSRQYFEGVDVSRFLFPDELVWVLIGSVGALFVGEGMLQTIGLNLAFVLLVLYFFQGLAIAIHILREKAFPKWVWVIVFGLILLQPMFMGLVIGFGLFDIWVDFRKIRVTPPPDSMNSME
jgi:uncharacterized protein YybS (DUF2232 family)